MNYDKFAFFPPPRPENKINTNFLSVFEKQKNWVAQAKLDGTYNFIGISPEKEMFCLKRDGTPHARWQPSEENKSAFRYLPGNGWYVFCAELMNDKTPDIKNINYIHDIIVDSGEMLLGSTYLERHYRLTTLFNPVESGEDHYLLIDEHTWLASIFKDKFIERYRSYADIVEIEGLVLKNTDILLSPSDMSKGMVKIRKSTKNYGF